MEGLEPIGASGLNPRDPLRNDLIVWIAAGLSMGIAGGIVFRPVVRTVFGLAVGLGIGLAGGLGTRLAGNAWLRYVIAMTLMRRTRTQPWRFGRFLSWCYQAGILREAGNAYQFRHLELRDWLQASAPDRSVGMSHQTSRPDDPAQANAALG
jgi:hypothetical protein